MGCLSSSASPKILAFGSHCSTNFNPILDFFIPNFKLKYEDLQNIKADSVNRVVFDLHQIKHRAFFLGHPVVILDLFQVPSSIMTGMYVLESISSGCSKYGREHEF